MTRRSIFRALAIVSACLAAASAPAPAQQAKASPADTAPWKFVVGGDSRNCGNVVMPAVAAGAASAGAAFYWHLGDFRALYDFDEDLVAARRVASEKPYSITDYQRAAWDDFIQSQLAPFGSTPVFLAIGNHELVAPKTRLEFLAHFADWFNAPPVQAQRLKDNPKDHRMKSYYHWVRGGVDFLSLDNASNDQFDTDQISFVERVVNRDISDSSITAIVAGMHAALPDGLASDHSMSDWAQGEYSGRRVYGALLKAQAAGKKVYALASHSHFYMSGIFDSPYWRAHGGVIPGWIVGTTGAVRYALPPGAAQAKEAKTNTYGYLVGTVSPDGSIRFDFQEIQEPDIPSAVATRFGADFVHQCFVANIRKSDH
jgi:calcineurin-like phosphoesterase family protein